MGASLKINKNRKTTSIGNVPFSEKTGVQENEVEKEILRSLMIMSKVG